MRKIDSIWCELEEDVTATSGILYRRYSGTVLPDLYIAVKLPEKLRCIAASIDNSINIKIDQFQNLRDIKIEIQPDVKNASRQYLILTLLNYDHSDIFSVLAEDIIYAVSELNNHKELVRILLNRFLKWQSIFDNAATACLGPEQQQGIYGELFFLRMLLQSGKDALSVLSGWVGPENKIHDFQYGGWAFEVKTTHGNNHQKVIISSERQLDTSNLEQLILFHLSVDVKQLSGETLNQIVKEISELLSYDLALLNTFNRKLIEGGYFQHHHQLYQATGYFIRKETLYNVRDAFPRIEEADLRPGVGDVKYSVILSNCTSYIIEMNQVFSKLKF